MPEFTPNLNLKQQLPNEYYDRESDNTNLKKIDAAIKGLEDDKVSSEDLTEVDERVTQQLAQINVNPTFNNTIDTESADLGEELINSGGWVLGNGWTGDLATGFTHSIDAAEPLTFPLNALASKLYEVSFTIESADADHGFKLNVTIGDSFPFEIYRGAGNIIVYKNGIETDYAGDLKIIPKTNFVGTIKNISVKEIIGYVNPTTRYFDSDESLNHELRTTKADLDNIFSGRGSGSRNTSGTHNTSQGIGALARNTSGYFNTAFGFNALLKNTVGSRNAALGYATLQNNSTGHRNVALGSFALNRNTHGHNNVAIGADALWYNDTGNHNIALGYTAQEHNDSGNGNIAIGYRALLSNEISNFNVAIGYDAGGKVKSKENVMLGAFAGDGTTTGMQNTLIGAYTMRGNVTGERNVALGTFAGKTSTGNNNTIIGYNSADGLNVGSSNIFIGNGTTTSNPTRQNWLNVGNSLYADMYNHAYGVGIENPTAILHLKAGTVVRPALKLTANASLTTEKHGGAFEFDGLFLYFTTNDGVRRKVHLEGQVSTGGAA